MSKVGSDTDYDGKHTYSVEYKVSIPTMNVVTASLRPKDTFY